MVAVSLNFYCVCFVCPSDALGCWGSNRVSYVVKSLVCFVKCYVSQLISANVAGHWFWIVCQIFCVYQESCHMQFSQVHDDAGI